MNMVKDNLHVWRYREDLYIWKWHRTVPKTYKNRTSTIEYLWSLKKTVADYCLWFPLLKASNRNDHNFAGEPITQRHDYGLKKFSTHDWHKRSLAGKLAQSKVNFPHWLGRNISLWVWVCNSKLRWSHDYNLISNAADSGQQDGEFETSSGS